MASYRISTLTWNFYFPRFPCFPKCKIIPACLKILRPSAARQLGKPVHSQSANFGKYKLNSHNLTGIILHHSVHAMRWDLKCILFQGANKKYFTHHYWRRTSSSSFHQSTPSPAGFWSPDSALGGVNPGIWEKGDSQAQQKPGRVPLAAKRSEDGGARVIILDTPRTLPLTDQGSQISRDNSLLPSILMCYQVDFTLATVIFLLFCMLFDGAFKFFLYGISQTAYIYVIFLFPL